LDGALQSLQGVLGQPGCCNDIGGRVRLGRRREHHSVRSRVRKEFGRCGLSRLTESSTFKVYWSGVPVL